MPSQTRTVCRASWAGRMVPAKQCCPEVNMNPRHRLQSFIESGTLNPARPSDKAVVSGRAGRWADNSFARWSPVTTSTPPVGCPVTSRAAPASITGRKRRRSSGGLRAATDDRPGASGTVVRRSVDSACRSGRVTNGEKPPRWSVTRESTSTPPPAGWTPGGPAVSGSPVPRLQSSSGPLGACEGIDREIPNTHSRIPNASTWQSFYPFGIRHTLSGMDPFLRRPACAPRSPGRPLCWGPSSPRPGASPRRRPPTPMDRDRSRRTIGGRGSDAASTAA